MVINYERNIRRMLFNPASQGYKPPKSHTAQIRRSSPTPHLPYTPNFLDTIRCFCENVAFHADPDQKSEPAQLSLKNMSQKNCRFSS